MPPGRRTLAVSRMNSVGELNHCSVDDDSMIFMLSSGSVRMAGSASRHSRLTEGGSFSDGRLAISQSVILELRSDGRYNSVRVPSPAPTSNTLGLSDIEGRCGYVSSHSFRAAAFCGVALEPYVPTALENFSATSSLSMTYWFMICCISGKWGIPSTKSAGIPCQAFCWFSDGNMASESPTIA